MRSLHDADATAIERCAVEDKVALADFRRKLAEWLDWLVGDDDHTICRQVWQMNWSYVTFRVINEARRLAFRSNKASIIRNDILFDFITAGFVTTQSLAIRRLDEREATQSDKQVISLRRLVADVCRHQHLFTREVFVGYGGAPFDPKPGKARHWQRIHERPAYWSGVEVSTESYPTSGPEAWEFSEWAHEVFDRLSGTYPWSRQRGDNICVNVYSTLERMIDDPSVKQARQLSNKYLAHAADSLSREQTPLDQFALSFNQIDKAHECLLTVSGFVASTSLYETSIGAIPTPQFDVFEHAELSGLDEHHLRRLKRLAACLTERRQRWIDTAADRLQSSVSRSPAWIDDAKLP